ncbi:MAG: hypothetical protein GXP55_21260 [Deltaproteobacteria bacterium]|nr:hypothetical protein [Deltaproteobacteria bacterium]
MMPLLVACSLLCAWSPLTTRADESLDAGFTALDQGDFDVAAAAFDAALAGDGLSRPELVALLEARAALHFALHDEAALDADLGWLAALDPGHAFGDDRPPDLARRFVEIEQHHPGALEVVATALPSDASVGVRARVERVPEGMDVRLRVCTRQERAAWRCVDGGQASSPLSASGGVYYYAEALGPGGAVVASAGSASDPLHLAPPVESGVVEPTTPTLTPGTSTEPSAQEVPSRGHGLAIGLGIGGGALLVALTVVLALTLGGNAGIHVRAPTVR